MGGSRETCTLLPTRRVCAQPTALGRAPPRPISPHLAHCIKQPLHKLRIAVVGLAAQAPATGATVAAVRTLARYNTKAAGAAGRRACGQGCVREFLQAAPDQTAGCSQNSPDARLSCGWVQRQGRHTPRGLTWLPRSRPPGRGCLA